MSGAPCSQLSAGMRCSSNAMLSSSERAASHHGDQRGAQPWRVLLQPCVLPHAFKSRMPARHRGACALAAAHVPALSYSALDRRRRGCFLPQPAPLRGCRHKPSQRSAVVCQSAGGSQAVGPGAGGGASITTTHWSKQVLDFVQAQFLPLGLVVGILCGYCWPHYGTIAASQSLHRFATIGIFTISGLCLRPAQIQQTMHEWRAILYSCASIWFLTPWVALLVLQLPLVPREFPLGVALFACMPTTLSTAVALSQAVGANVPVALAVTLLSNLGGILTMPFMIARTVGAGLGVRVNPTPLLLQLLQCVLLPLVAAMVSAAGLTNSARLWPTSTACCSYRCRGCRSARPRRWWPASSRRHCWPSHLWAR
eukprot:jgi/Mesvir1/556/Mv11407-RA.2